MTRTHDPGVHMPKALAATGAPHDAIDREGSIPNLAALRAFVVAAQHHVRYSKPLGEADTHALVLASIVSDMAYLVHACPTTKLACEKLAAMRAAVRKLGPVTEEPRGEAK